MSTPPPSAPYPAAPQVSPEPAQPRLSEPARIINTFIAPRKTFEDIRVNSSWWVPWLLTTLFAILFGAIAVQKIDLVQFTRHQIEQSKARQSQIEQLPPEQQERAMERGASFTKAVFYAGPVFFNLLIGLICAAILMAVFNFGFAAEVTFSQAMAIFFYSFLPRVIVALLIGVSLLTASDPNSIDIAGNPMPTNAGFFMDPQGNKFLYSFISNLDIFALWTVVLLGLGFAVVSKNKKLTPGTAIVTMFIIYGLLTVIGAGFKAAF